MAAPLRITGLYMLAAKAARAAVLLGHSHSSFPRKTSATVCRPWSLLRKALIRAAKPSYTAGTLCEMQP
jgi:hypothetical protein